MAHPAIGSNPSLEAPVKQPVPGGVAAAVGLDADKQFSGIWEKVLSLDKAPEKDGHVVNLAALGLPDTVATQVVSGTNYVFKWKSGAEVTVWSQPWMHHLEVTDMKQLPAAALAAPVKHPALAVKQPVLGVAAPVKHPALAVKQAAQPDLRRAAPAKQPALAVKHPVLGGVAGAHGLDAESRGIWEKVLSLDKAPEKDGHAVNLAALGLPDTVATQVVSGMNYVFKWKSGAEVTVWSQPWMHHLEVTDMKQLPAVLAD